MAAIQPAHLVGTGGAVGALLRYYLVARVEREGFPVGTLTVNVLGSFALGPLTVGGVEGELLLLIGIGACGSFTTFSAVSYETVRLWEAGRQSRAVGNAVGNLLGAFAALRLALLVVKAL